MSTSTLGVALSAGLTQITEQVPDIMLWLVGIFGVALVIGVALASFSRARRSIVGAVGGGKRRR